MSFDVKVSERGTYVPPAPVQVLPQQQQQQVTVQSATVSSAPGSGPSLHFPSPLLVMQQMAQQNARWELPDGTYVGAMQNGVPQGKGVITYRPTNANKYATFEGDFDKGQIHGKGVMLWSNGDRYTGTVADGKVTGKGLKEFHSSGARYEGDVVNGAPEGQGVYTSFYGSKWTGAFANGKSQGYGEHSYKVGNDKYTYKGHFDKGEYSGQGELLRVYSTGEEFLTTGTFREGKIWDGRGYFTKFTNPCAECYVGSYTYKNGVDQSGSCVIL